MTLQLYILRQLVQAFLIALGSVLLATLIPSVFHAVHELPGLGAITLLEYLPLVLADVAPYLVPIAFLLATVGTYGRLARDKELVACHLTGRHPARLLTPGLLLAVPLSLLTIWVMASVAPDFKYRQRNFLRQASMKLFRALAETSTQFDLGEFYLHASAREGSVLHDVILGVREPGSERFFELVADEVDLVFEEDWLLRLELERAWVVAGDVELMNESPSIRLDLRRIDPIDPYDRDRPKYMSSAELHRNLARDDMEPEREIQLRYQIHRRWAFSTIYFVFLLLGASTGILLRAGNVLAAFTGATGYALVYYVLALRAGKVLATNGTLPPEVGAWSINALFLLLGVLLSRRALLR